MGIWLIFQSQAGENGYQRAYGLTWIVHAAGDVPGKAPAIKTVPQTDTGGQVEHTKALERTMLKELGKLPP